MDENVASKVHFNREVLQRPVYQVLSDGEKQSACSSVLIFLIAWHVPQIFYSVRSYKYLINSVLVWSEQGRHPPLILSSLQTSLRSVWSQENGCVGLSERRSSLVLFQDG